MKIRITYIDGTTADGHIKISDKYAWEQKFKKSLSEFEKDPALGDILWMTYRAISRVTEGMQPFELWVNQVEDFDVVDSNPKS